MLSDDFHPSILRAYDIRGTWGDTLCMDDAWRLGGKLASYLRDTYEPLKFAPTDTPQYPAFERTYSHDPKPFVCGIVRDGRFSSPILHTALCYALRACGIHVIDFGVGPSPYAYYAAHHTPIDGVVMITASHNPPQDNGFKIMIYGESLSAESLQKLADYPIPKAAHEAYSHKNTNLPGTLYTDDTCLHAYGMHTTAPAHMITLPKKIIWDFAGGAMTCLKPWIVQNLNTEHIFLCDTLDPHFSHHDPDPTVPKNRELIQQTLRDHQCDVGFAFDGDGDRVVVLKHDGHAINGDRLVAILAHDLLKNQPGAVILGDIKSSSVLVESVQKAGGHPILTRTGHSFIKAKMKQESALLAGEMSGHIFFADENKGYDDGLYAACRVLRLLSQTNQTLYDLDHALPRYHTTPEIKIEVSDHQKFLIIESLKKLLTSDNKTFNDLDGVRRDNEQGWWLVRASNTQAILVVRMEARLSSDLSKLSAECAYYLQQCGIYLPCKVCDDI